MNICIYIYTYKHNVLLYIYILCICTHIPVRDAQPLHILLCLRTARRLSRQPSGWAIRKWCGSSSITMESSPEAPVLIGSRRRSCRKTLGIVAVVGRTGSWVSPGPTLGSPTVGSSRITKTLVLDPIASYGIVSYPGGHKPFWALFCLPEPGPSTYPWPESHCRRGSGSLDL